ncbi:acyl-CoA dehydrogenase family protein [Natrinema caseinilyticum]|uniref:acyl-CoA dehydrogenase family protein n=1 Tax=Natrinema caseinilyticum TaxID=2961570 RepID=UPI0020C1F82D|nr:acyl-CoA dehydrogenase family protein [Natrinema caseinilyticum]
MDFALSQEQQMMQRLVEDICSDYDLEYWREKDDAGEFPHEIWDDLTEAGFAGLTVSEEYGGEGLGMEEVVAVALALGRNGGGVSGPNMLTLGPVFGGISITEHGTEDQKERWLPAIADGAIASLGLTEPDAGLDTAGIKTTAQRDGDGYSIDGTKIWTTGAHVSDYIITLARTSPIDEGSRHDGISLFVVPADADGITTNKIDKLSMRSLGSCEVVFDDVHVPDENLLGTEDDGFYHVLGTLNTERIIWAAIPLAAGELALDLAVDYANEREAFERPIGENQGVQFPLAESKMELETAKLMIYKAASLYDEGADCSMEANAAKFMAARAGFKACDRAIQTHGGMGFADEYHVERLYRDVRLARVAPVSDELVKSFVSTNVLDLPRSY